MKNLETTMEKTKTKKSIGVVLNDAKDKTVLVEIARIKSSRLYDKKYKVTKKFKVHDEENSCKAGDVVEISSTRPISKEKFYKILKKIK